MLQASQLDKQSCRLDLWLIMHCTVLHRRAKLRVPSSITDENLMPRPTGNWIEACRMRPPAESSHCCAACRVIWILEWIARMPTEKSHNCHSLQTVKTSDHTGKGNAIADTGDTYANIATYGTTEACAANASQPENCPAKAAHATAIAFV
jgi:hypothetical protein